LELTIRYSSLDIDKQEIGEQAVWSASSAKIGGAVQLLRDGNDKTFWQSDGSLPHFVSAFFLRRVSLAEIRIKVDYKSDESYTPCRLCIRIGSSMHDLREARAVDIPQLTGWFSISMLDDHRCTTVFSLL
jgi:anaphase-promoting complex subunit 10